jgi:predicted Zn-dependent peptidase
MEFKHAQLDNGLNIVAEVNPQAKSLAAGFFVRTGSRDETPDISGVSHFLEHMVFKGTPTRSALEVNLAFDSMGANYNAFTSEENTVFYGEVLPEFQADLLDLLGDILRPSLRQDDFDTEKQVILDEIALYEDQPHFRLYDNMMSHHFKGHPLGNSILGTPQSITDLQRDQMLEYFNRRYSATNVACCAVGNVDFDALVAKVGEMCGQWEAYDVDRDTRSYDGSRDRTIIADEKLTRQNIGLMNPAPSAQDAERFATQLLSSVIGDSTGSRLYYALVDTAIADDADMHYSAMDHAGGLLTFVSCESPGTCWPSSPKADRPTRNCRPPRTRSPPAPRARASCPWAD